MIDTAQLQWQRACAVALTELPKMGPARLHALFTDLTADLAWNAIVEGRSVSDDVARSCAPDPSKISVAWTKAARKIEPLEVLERYEHAGVHVWWRMGDYPYAFHDDPWAPAVAFWAGNDKALEMPRVAIVGTRHATREGLEIARRFGAELAEAGVSVVSGLALGIDGAAHHGALEASWIAPPIAVVGSGLDVIYPKRHAHLWNSVRDRGLLISETPLGGRPESWRFPARNRIIASLADVVVVVESHGHGGSLITAEEATVRNVTVVAVPGSINSRASEGTNQLIAAGCPIVTCVQDILHHLPLESVVSDAVKHVDPSMIEIFDAIDWSPTSTNDVMLRTGLDLGEVASGLVFLEQAGLIVGNDGWWQRSDAEPQDGDVR